MVADEVQLACGSWVLELRWDENRWCELRLFRDDEEHELGADALDVVVERLLTALEQETMGQPTTLIDGREAVWVLSLAEKHCSLFAEREDAATVLHVQAEDGSLLTRASLSEDERRAWLAQLSQLQERFPVAPRT